MRVFQTIWIIPIAAAIAVFSGCGGDDGQQTEHLRGSGNIKADLTGSCVGFCGKMSDDGCWCDDLCTTYNDCCQDKASVCVPVAGCKVDCDCDQGQLCTPEGTCVNGFAPAYCCTKAGCQAGWPCTNPDGSKGTCAGNPPPPPPPACKVDCDCDQGEICAQGQCVTGIIPAYCCTKAGCQAGWPCTNPDGSQGTCAGNPPPPPPACKVDCDCDQGQLCTPEGTCVNGFAPAYCCTKAGCQAGWPCTNPDGSQGTCP